MDRSREDVRVFVDGQRLRSFKSVSVSRSLTSAAGSFQINVVERTGPDGVARAGGGQLPWPIPPDSEIEVRLGKTLLIRGVAEVVRAQVEDTSTTIAAAGRDVIGDMIDGVSLTGPYEWTDSEIFNIAVGLAGSFGTDAIPAFDRLDDEVSKPFKRFALQPGETAFEALARACRLRGILPIGSADGNIILARPDQADVSPGRVAWGDNVLRFAVAYDSSNRFRNYVVRGQGPTVDGFDVGQALTPEGRALDSGIRDTRSTVLISEGAADVDSARKSAEWEATTRAAKGAQITAQVVGWREELDGQPWTIGRTVQVELPPARISGQMLIEGVNLRDSEDSGSVTELTLVRKDAYQPKPEQEPEEDPANRLRELEEAF